MKVVNFFQKLILKNKDKIIFNFGKGIQFDDLNTSKVKLYIEDRKIDTTNSSEVIKLFLNRDSTDKMYLLFEEKEYKIKRFIDRVLSNDGGSIDNPITLTVDTIFYIKK